MSAYLSADLAYEESVRCTPRWDPPHPPYVEIRGESGGRTTVHLNISGKPEGLRALAAALEAAADLADPPVTVLSVEALEAARKAVRIAKLAHTEGTIP
jgi:hypothetical protein